MFLTREYLYNLVTGKIKGPGGVFLRGCLLVLSLVYGVAVIILAGFYSLRPKRFSAKVISVGNITLGGTGKTTLVEYLSVKLSLSGHKIAVLSRGYKRDSRRPGVQGLGDEPAMLQNNLPLVRVVVDKNRIKAAQTAIRDYASDTLILDDGLQQWKISICLSLINYRKNLGRHVNTGQARSKRHANALKGWPNTPMNWGINFLLLLRLKRQSGRVLWHYNAAMLSMI